MCENCKLDAMVADELINPNPQEGREYPTGWDLQGLAGERALAGIVGSKEGDTLRAVYTDLLLMLAHAQLAQMFTGKPMEVFCDGKFMCYRPALLKRGKPQPPAWHVVLDEPEETEQEEIARRQEVENFIRGLLGDDDDPLT